MITFNKTHFDTRVIRRMACAVHNKLTKLEGRLPTWRALKITVVYSKGCVSGRASYSGWNMLLRVPKSGVDQYTLASLIWHELFHSYGYRHRQMADDDNFPADWAKGLFSDEQLPVKEQKPKKKKDMQLERYDRVLKRESAWRTKMKRAQTALKKLKRQWAYYEKALMAAGKLKEKK